MEHTHLVKGLDYALLNKVRADNEAKPASAAPTALGGSDREDSRGGTAPGAASAATFQSRLGRNVYNTLFGPKFDQPIPAAAVSELFLPKRTAFIYELEDSSQATDVPTTLRRAKEDCPVPKKTMYASVDGAVLERLAKLMAYMSTSSTYFFIMPICVLIVKLIIHSCGQMFGLLLLYCMLQMAASGRLKRKKRRKCFAC